MNRLLLAALLSVAACAGDKNNQPQKENTPQTLNNITYKTLPTILRPEVLATIFLWMAK